MEWYKQLAFQQESNDRRLMFYPEKRELFGTTGGYSMILHTERLDLRKLTAEDRADLNEILQDQDVMYAYEHAFSDDEVTDWLNRRGRLPVQKKALAQRLCYRGRNCMQTICL